MTSSFATRDQNRVSAVTEDQDGNDSSIIQNTAGGQSPNWTVQPKGTTQASSALNQDTVRAADFDNAMNFYKDSSQFETVHERRTAGNNVQRQSYQPKMKISGARAQYVGNFSIQQKSSSVGKAYLAQTTNPLMRQSIKSQGNGKKKNFQMPQGLPQIANQNEVFLKQLQKVNMKEGDFSAQSRYQRMQDLSNAMRKSHQPNISFSMPKTACTNDAQATMDAFIDTTELQSDHPIKQTSRSSLASNRRKQQTRVASQLVPERKQSSQNERNALFDPQLESFQVQELKTAQNSQVRPKTIEKVSLVVKRFKDPQMGGPFQHHMQQQNMENQLECNIQRNVATATIHYGSKKPSQLDQLSPMTTQHHTTNRNFGKLRSSKHNKSRSPKAGKKLAALCSSSNERMKTVTVSGATTTNNQRNRMTTLGASVTPYQQFQGIECIFHKDAISMLQTQVKLLRHELANKQRFIDGIIQESMLYDEVSGKRAMDINKLKDELSAAFRTIAQRDVEINRLKASKKVRSYNQVKNEINRLKDLVKAYDQPKDHQLGSNRNILKPYQGHNISKQARDSSTDLYENPIILLEKSIESDQRSNGPTSIKIDQLAESIDQIDLINADQKFSEVEKCGQVNLENSPIQTAKENENKGEEEDNSRYKDPYDSSTDAAHILDSGASAIIKEQQAEIQRSQQVIRDQATEIQRTSQIIKEQVAQIKKLRQELEKQKHDLKRESILSYRSTGTRRPDTKEQEISDLKQYRSLIECDLDQKTEFADQLEAKIKESEKEVDNLQAKIREQETAQLLADQKIKEAQQELAQLNSQIEDLKIKEQEALKLQSSLEQRNTQNRELNDKLSALQQNYTAQVALLESEKQHETRRYNEKVQEMTAAQEAAQIKEQKDQEELRAQISSLETLKQQLNNVLQSQMELLDNQKNAAELEKQKANELIAEQSAQIQQLEAEKEQLIADYERQIDDLRQDQAEVQTEKADLSVNLQEMPKDEEIEELRGQVIDLEIKMSNDTRQYKAQLAQSDMHVTQLRSEIAYIKEENCNIENRKQLGQLITTQGVLLDILNSERTKVRNLEKNQVRTEDQEYQGQSIDEDGPPPTSATEDQSDYRNILETHDAISVATYDDGLDENDTLESIQKQIIDAEQVSDRAALKILRTKEHRLLVKEVQLIKNSMEANSPGKNKRMQGSRSRMSLEERNAYIEREGFSEACLTFIKQSEELQAIVQAANEKMYNLRQNCDVYTVAQSRIAPVTAPDQGEKPYSPVRALLRNARQDRSETIEEEVILKNDFYEFALEDLGLEVFILDSTQTEKLDNCLQTIGSIGIDTSSNRQTPLIKIDVLIAAMRVLNYQFAGNSLLEDQKKLTGFNFRQLTTRSIRIMNRFAQVVAQFINKSQTNEKTNQEESTTGKKALTTGQVIYGIFKHQIQTQEVQNRPSNQIQTQEVQNRPSNNKPAMKSPSLFDKVVWADNDNDNQSEKGDDDEEPQPMQQQQASQPEPNSGSSKIQLVDPQHFYATLVKLKVRRSMQDVPNLRKFLTFSGSQKSLALGSELPPIMLRKLSKATDEFMKSEYFQSYGLTKRKLAVAEPESVKSIIKRQETQAQLSSQKKNKKQKEEQPLPEVTMQFDTSDNIPLRKNDEEPEQILETEEQY